MDNRQFKLSTIFKDMLSTAISLKEPEAIGYPPSEMFLTGGDRAQTSEIAYQQELLNSGVSMNDLPMREIEGFSGAKDVYTRRQRYIQYDMLEEMMSEIDAALNTYADEASGFDVNNHVCKVECSNQKIKEEIEFLLFNILKIDDRIWGIIRNVCKYGDGFVELLIDENNPEMGILGWQELDPYTMWRIQSRRNKLIEFQQSKFGPDYEVVIEDLIKKAREDKNPNEYVFWSNRGQTKSSKPIRFAPAQVVHFKIGANRREIGPYGISILASARRPAYNLKLMEDAMLIYRLTRSPDKRLYYVDVQEMPPTEVQNYLNKFKDSVKRKKVYNERTGSVDEMWNPWSIDDDLFIPVKPELNTRVEPLAGSTLATDIDDTIYFRKKLYVALKIPPGFLEQTIESQSNRLTLSTIDMRFARVILRIQKSIANGIKDIAMRHLELCKVPKTLYEDLNIVVTPSSDWQEMSKSEILNDRFNRASSASGLNIFHPKWVMENILKMSEDEADEAYRKRMQFELETSEIESQKALISAKAQAEVEKANQINAAKIEAEKQQMGLPTGAEGEEGATESPDGQTGGGGVPSEEEVDQEIPALGGEEGGEEIETPEIPKQAGQKYYSINDREAELEDRNI